jgi:hypothetical protein
MRAADDVEHHLGPVRVIELERHARDDQQQEAGDDQEMEEALEGQEAGEPFAAFLGAELGLAELL